MLPDRVNEMLHNYREYLGRCKYLEVEISENARLIESIKKTAISNEAAPHAQSLDGMPHGTAISNPTERIAMMFAEGYEPKYVQELCERLKELQAEYREKSTTVAFVDAWLLGLSDRERWIVTQQVIDGVTWRKLSAQHLSLFGEPRTKGGLRKLRAKALEKIYCMAS